jgi:hypothetical protein
MDIMTLESDAATVAGAALAAAWAAHVETLDGAAREVLRVRKAADAAQAAFMAAWESLDSVAALWQPPHNPMAAIDEGAMVRIALAAQVLCLGTFFTPENTDDDGEEAGDGDTAGTDS